ncbi:MAG: hypothetical protein WBC63_08420 [Candidatus Bipolaricaulia bacterium]
MTLRRLALVISTLLLVGACAQAQDPLAFEPDYFFSGFSGALWHADLSGLNEALDDAAYPELPSVVPLFGQGTTIGFAEGPRVGFSMVSGETSARVDARIARMSFTFGGGLLEWGISTGDLSSIAFGVMLGGGTSVLTLVDHLPESFEDALLIPFRTKLDRWLYAIEPFVSTHGAVFDWLDLRLRAGYLFTIGCAWKAEEAAYSYPIPAFGGPSLEVAIAVDFDKLLEDLLGDLEATPVE